MRSYKPQITACQTIKAGNPNLEGGAISNLDDYAKILMMQLNDGVCGEERILSENAIMEMRTDRASDLDEGICR